MSILFFEGFETVGTELALANQATTRPRIEKRWDATSSGGIPSSDSFFLMNDYLSEGFAVNMGTNSFSGGNMLQWDVPAAKQVAPGAGSPTWIVGARVHIPSASRTFSVLEVRGAVGIDDDARSISVYVENSANLVAIRGEISIEIGRQNGVVTPDSWVYIETRFRIGDSGEGILEVRVNGTTEINPDPVDTNEFMTVAANKFQFKTVVSSTNAGDFVGYDDIYILDADTAPHTSFLGSTTRVQRLDLGGDSDPLQWSPSTPGTHYTLVDENGADAADYVDGGSGEIEMYTVDALPGNGAIYGVKLEAELLSLTGGTPTADVRMDSGGSFDAETHTVDDTVNYEVFSLVAEQDPAGGGWTRAAVEALKIGIKNNV